MPPLKSHPGRRRRKNPSATRRREENSSVKRSHSTDRALPHIAELMDSGEITVGVLAPVGCVAVASDEGNTLAMRVRRNGETLFELLIRLDRAVAKAYTEDVFTDEINPPPTPSRLR
jgi:hypothetical protein